MTPRANFREVLDLGEVDKDSEFRGGRANQNAMATIFFDMMEIRFLSNKRWSAKLRRPGYTEEHEPATREQSRESLGGIGQNSTCSNQSPTVALAASRALDDHLTPQCASAKLQLGSTFEVSTLDSENTTSYKIGGFTAHLVARRTNRRL